MKFLLCLAMVLFVQNVHADEHEWQLRRDKEGVAVHTRKVDGSPILEYKAVTVVDAPIARVIELFQDPKQTPRWFYQCTHSESIGEEDGAKIDYFVIHLPGPVSERDSVFKSIKSTDAKGVVTYVLSALPDRLPRVKGKVRVTYLKSIWRFTPLPGGRTEVFFQQHSDPGGFLPGFVVNPLVVDIPFSSLKNLRALLTSE